MQVSYHLPPMAGVSRWWHRKRVASWTAPGVGRGAAGGAWGSELGEGQRHLESWCRCTCVAAMQWEPARTCQHLFVRTGCRFRKVTRSRPGPASTYIEEMPPRLFIIFALRLQPPSSCTHASFCWPASAARAFQHRPPVSNECIVLQTHASRSRHPCRPEASGLGNQSATQPMPSGRLRFLNASFVHVHHVAVQRIDTKVPKRFWATPRACFLPPCRAELHRSASDAAFMPLQTAPGK